MKKLLKKNICDLGDHAVLSEVEDLSTRREACVGGSLEYACRYWTRHLANVPGDGPHAKRVQGAIDEFFAKRLLCWIEVLSIAGHLGAAFYAINDIRQWYISAGISNYEQADDSERLLLEYFDAICDSPSHIYHSALPLSPSSSWIRKCYEAEVVGEVKVLMGLPNRWDTCSRTILLEGKPSAFAHWVDIIAVGMESNVVLLDAITGIRTSVLCGHKDMISSLAFSLDGTLLVSKSHDKTVKLWDVQTGGVIRTFEDDTSVILAASISPDGNTIALGTKNGAIQLWDIRAGKCHSIETGQDKQITVICFSPIDPRRLLSSSWNRTVRQWDVDGHQIGTSYNEADRVDHLAYASDGTRFASCGGKVATVRDSESGAIVVKLDAPDRTSLTRCCFSPDGRFVACGGTTLCVWDITVSGARLIGPLVGHSNSISFVAFSSSLISGSWDRTVKFWQSSSFLSDQMSIDRKGALHGSTPIVSAKLFVEDGTIVTSDESGIVKTWDLATGTCKKTFSNPAEGEHDTHLAGDTLIMVWWTDQEMEYHVWDVGKGKLLQKVRGSLSDLVDLKVSGDGSKVFGLGMDYIEAVSVETGEDAGRAKLNLGEGSTFFVHGSQVGIDDERGKGWDFGGPEVSDLMEFPDRPRFDLIDWSTGRGIKARWIEDTVTKRLVFRLPERYLKSDSEVEWDGRYLLVWSRSGDVLIIDFRSVFPR